MAVAPFPRRAFLVFEGVDSAFYCWLNGQASRGVDLLATRGTRPSLPTCCPLTSPFLCAIHGSAIMIASACSRVCPQFVGYSQDSRLPAEFDVTTLLQPGERNVLAVQVKGRPPMAAERWARPALLGPN